MNRAQPRAVKLPDVLKIAADIDLLMGMIGAAVITSASCDKSNVIPEFQMS